MNGNDFTDKCIQIVKEYVSKNYKVNVTNKNFFIVWSCKTLQNNKALVASNLRDGLYFELTYNGDKDEIYLDVYKKRENIVIK